MATEEMISGLTTADDSAGDTGAEPAPAPASDYHAPQVDDRYVPAGEPVKLEAPEQKQRSRREEATRRVAAEVAAEAEKKWQERFGQLENQYKGLLDALQRQPPQQPATPVYAPPAQQAQAPAASPDVRRLEREAEDLLAKNDYRGWQEKLLEVAEARAEARVAERLKAIQPAQQTPAGPDPVLLYHAMQQPASKTHGPHAVLNIAQQQAQMLAAAGVPPGPARDARAFEMANEFLTRLTGGAPALAAPSPAQSNAGHVLATPASPRSATASSAADARDSAGKIVPTPKERSTAAFLVKKGAFKSENEYFAELARMHPERIER